MRPQALKALKGVDLIIHAGDIGSSQVLNALSEIAPVVAIRGNNDRADWAQALPERRTVEVAGHKFYLLHNLKELDLEPHQAGYQVVISGHSHKPAISWQTGLLFINPGSAGPRRFNLPVSLALLNLEQASIVPEIIELILEK